MRKIIQIATSFTAEGACLFALDNTGKVYRYNDNDDAWYPYPDIPKPETLTDRQDYLQEQFNNDISEDDVPF